MLSVKQGDTKNHFFESLVWLDLELNSGLPTIGKHFTHSANCPVEDKGVHAFPKVISSKVKVIARLDLELTFYDVTL